MRTLSWWCGVLLLAVWAAPRQHVSASPAHQIRGVDGLARAYDFILEARFDQVDVELRRACPPAPPEACEVLAATSLWWQILVDPEHKIEFVPAALGDDSGILGAALMAREAFA